MKQEEQVPKQEQEEKQTLRTTMLLQLYPLNPYKYVFDSAKFPLHTFCVKKKSLTNWLSIT